MAPLSSAQTLSHEEYLAQRYMPVLDVVRAVAVLSVVGFHLGEGSLDFLQGGVNVFFVLSGYLITTLALREESRRGSLDVRAFIVRRIFRILPLFYLVLGIYVVLVLGLHADDRVGDFGDALPWLFAYLQEWPVVHAGDEGLPLGVAWSLGIEEKFYVVWPFLAFVLLRGRSSRAQIAGLLATGLLLRLRLRAGHRRPAARALRVDPRRLPFSPSCCMTHAVTPGWEGSVGRRCSAGFSFSSRCSG